MYCAKRCLQLADPLLLRSGFSGLKAVAAAATASVPSIARALSSRPAGPAAGDRTSKRTKSHGPGGLQDTAEFIPKSVFAAGTSKKIRERERKKLQAFLQSEEERQAEEEEEVQAEDHKAFVEREKPRRDEPPDRPLSVAEWRQRKETSYVPQRYEFNMMDAMHKSAEELDIAKSLLTFVATQTGTLPYELLLKYLVLCVNGGHDGEVADVYDIMRARFPMLETSACSLFIQSFARTPRWREAIHILHTIDKVYPVAPRSYDRIIAGAVAHGDSATAWELYDEMTGKGLCPAQSTWETLFRGGPSESEAESDGVPPPGSISQSERQERLLSVLHYMRNNQLYPQQTLAHAISAWFQSLPGQKWKASWTTVNPNGACRCCGSSLESIHLTNEEYHQLKDIVMSRIIKGRDVFRKTTPEELNRFRKFVKEKPAFDVVVDGLNVALMTRNTRLKAETLLAVVLELERQGQVVLVLGRKHMVQPRGSFNQHSMRLVEKKAHCFFTDNISEDDPFLLYAALHSGNHCRFVSRDLMRDHKALMPDGVSRRLFFKWQRGNQMVVHDFLDPNRRVSFKHILDYDTIIQTDDNTWHIPYDDSVEERKCHEVPLRWLCLTKTH